MPCDTFGEILGRIGRPGKNQVCAILADTQNGIAYLHDRSIVHRDLIFRNIHYKKMKMLRRVNLADFGLDNFVRLCTVSKVGLKGQVESPHYFAAEVLRGEDSYSADGREALR